MTTKGIHLSWIVVSDLEKAIQFFTETVGLKVREKHDEFGWAELIGEDGGSALGIAQANEQEPMKPGENAVVTISVVNIEESIKKMKEQGMKFIGDIIEIPNMVKMQLFADDDDNRFQLVESLS